VYTIRVNISCIYFFVFTISLYFMHFINLSGYLAVSVQIKPVDQLTSGRTVNFPWQHLTRSRWVTIYMGKPSAVGQLTRPTQLFILSGSINE